MTTILYGIYLIVMILGTICGIQMGSMIFDDLDWNIMNPQSHIGRWILKACICCIGIMGGLYVLYVLK